MIKLFLVGCLFKKMAAYTTPKSFSNVKHILFPHRLPSPVLGRKNYGSRFQTLQGMPLILRDTETDEVGARSNNKSIGYLTFVIIVKPFYFASQNHRRF